ncbi:hypothetical protein DFH07DRAFT_847395 [Mycena maculata]|uniref:Decapping nuclease n=1 Tax=Mycena maculata TaxID=230809 RepID=A0AAD7MTE2_9AGAR|nr:hypothetical protein DFH07DRAFT_847395 [Mycena maculata]
MPHEKWNPFIRLITESDPPRCQVPALLGPPKQSACFSICNERLEVDSTAALRYFVHPPPQVNLRAGLEQFLNLPEEDRTFQRARRLDNVFTICLHSTNSEELLQAQFVTWRGILRKIMFGERLDLNVSYYRGVLYLEENSRGHDDDSECTYLGHKFESFCTTASPGGEPDTPDVDMHTLWNTAITRKLGSLNILLVGEVDCVKPDYGQNPSPENYVELKTRKIKGQIFNTPNRSKWDMQSHLLGAHQIFVGFHDGAGIVQKLESFAVRNMANAQHKIDWGARVLQGLRDYCARSATTNESVLPVWRVHSRYGYADIRELGPREVEKLNKNGVPRNGIIPLSFIEGLEKRMSPVSR